MKRLYFDLHNHSCLSPCADNDMTPNNLAALAVLAKIDIMALTDHNSSRNCPAFFKAAQEYGIVPVAGMELTTSEDIHVVCLFEDINDALDFDKEVYSHLYKVKNRPDIYGDQLICGENDEVVGTEEYLISNATDISYDDVPALVSGFNGICFPAHVDREANSVIETLGTFPEFPDFSCVEMYDINKREELEKKYPALKGKLVISGSDAHFIHAVRDASMYFEVPDSAETEDEKRRLLFEYLKNGANK